MSGHAGMPVLPLSELEWIGLVNENEDVLSEPRKNGRRGVFFLDFYLSWMSRGRPGEYHDGISDVTRKRSLYHLWEGFIWQVIETGSGDKR